MTTSPFSIVSTPSAATTSIFAPGLCSRAPWALQGRPARPASTALRATEDRLGPAACPAKLVYRGPQGQPARRATPGRPGRSAQSARPAPTASPDCRWAQYPHVHGHIVPALLSFSFAFVEVLAAAAVLVVYDSRASPYEPLTVSCRRPGGRACMDGTAGQAPRAAPGQVRLRRGFCLPAIACGESLPAIIATTHSPTFPVAQTNTHPHATRTHARTHAHAHTRGT